MTNPARNYDKGFSLSEYLAVIFIVLLLARFAIPAYREFLITTRVYTAASELHSALYFARSAAISNGGHVIICRCTNPNSESPTCNRTPSVADADSGWGDGWMIYLDVDRNGNFNEGDKVLAVQGKLFPTPSSGAIVPHPYRYQIRFNETGQTFGNYLRINIQRPANDSVEEHNRYLCIASGGRARVAKNACDNS